MNWTLSAQRRPDLSPEPQEPHRRPPWVLNYSHIYTFMWPDLCRGWNPVYMILFAHWSVWTSEKKQQQNIVLRIIHCLFQQQHNKVGVCSFVFWSTFSSSRWTFGFSGCLEELFLKLKLFKNTNVTVKINSGHSFHACSGDIHTTDHGCYGQGYGWALIPPLISDDHLTATETLWLQRSKDGD